MFYATWSKGFRPGGINRQPDTPPYAPDFLTNYEAGLEDDLSAAACAGTARSTTRSGKEFQFSFLGANSLTVIQNGRNAIINGIETDINYVRGGLSLNAAAAYTNAKTRGNICHAAIVVDPIARLQRRRLKRTPASTSSRCRRDTATDHAEVQGERDGAVHLAEWAGSNARAGRDHLSRARRLSDLDPALECVSPAKSSSTSSGQSSSGYRLGADYSVELFATNVFDKRNDLSTNGLQHLHAGEDRARTAADDRTEAGRALLVAKRPILGEKGRGMNRSKPFTWIAAAIFALVAIVHIIRLFTHFQVILGTHSMPMWVSYLGSLSPAFLSWMLCREARGATERTLSPRR